MKPLIFELPFPPNQNGIVKRNGRRTIAPGLFLFRSLAREQIRRQLRQMRPRPKLIRWPVAVLLTLHRPDLERRDLDNMPKAVLDLLTWACVWTDDSLVHDLRLVWATGLFSGGKTVVRISELA